MHPFLCISSITIIWYWHGYLAWNVFEASRKFFAFCKLIIETNEWRQIIQSSTTFLKDNKNELSKSFLRTLNEALYSGFPHWPRAFYFFFAKKQLRVKKKKTLFTLVAGKKKKKSRNDFCILISRHRPQCLELNSITVIFFRCPD